VERQAGLLSHGILDEEQVTEPQVSAAHDPALPSPFTTPYSSLLFAPAAASIPRGGCPHAPAP